MLCEPNKEPLNSAAGHEFVRTDPPSGLHKDTEEELCLHLILLQQLADEFLGRLAGVAEELLVELIVYRQNVPQGVPLGLTQERRSSTQPGRQECHHPV